jgi:hypothetical protein
VEHQTVTPLGQNLALLSNVRLGWKSLPYSSSRRLFASDRERSFMNRVTSRFEKKICPIFQNVTQKVSKAKKAKNIYNKAQFENPKHLLQTTFETLKYLQQTMS